MVNLEQKTAAEYLQTQTDIMTPANVNFLKELDQADKPKGAAELLKKNEAIVSGMENLLKSKVDTIVSKGEQMDDNDAKILIAYDALKDRYLGRKIPDNETERKTVALKIANDITNVKKFEAHEKTDRYYDFMTKTYSDTPSANTLDLNLDEISINTGNTAINAFLDNHTEVKQSLLSAKKNNHLRDIIRVTGLWNEKEEDPTSIRSQLNKQANAKQNGLRQEDRQNNTYTSMKEFSNDPDKCMEVANLLATNKEAFNTPANEDMVDLKDKFMDLVTSNYTTKKESDGLYRSRDDLHRDDGISVDKDGNVTKETAKLDKNNISLTVDGKNISVKNGITETSLDITRSTFEKGVANREKREENRELTQKYREDFEEKYMKDNNLTEESIKNLTSKESWKLQQDMNVAMITEVFTKDEKMYNAFMSEAEMDQDGPQSVRGESLGETFNTILTKINGSELVGFDCTTGRTTWEIKSDDKGSKYVELKQGKSLVKLGFDKILEKTIDARSQEEKQKDEVLEQDKLTTYTETASIETYENPGRVPDLRRALDKIDQPTEGEDGYKHIDLTDLNLTDKDVAFLSTKLGGLKDNNEKYVINLGNNVIEHAPKSIFTMKHIIGIDLTNNNLESLPKIEQEDGTTDHLTSLDVSSNSFDYFPEVTQFKNLQSLNISGNHISDISDVTSLNKLTTLRAHDIGLQTLPTTIGDMKNLQKLSLGQNKISELPTDFAKLTELTELYLGGNDLKGPITVSQCPKMQTLDVNGNKDMSDFPIIGTNNNIKYVDCRDTRIKSIPTGLKDQCPNLEDINIFDDVLTGAESTNEFLDGSLTTNGYQFKEDGQTKETVDMKTFFNPAQKFKYTETSAGNEANALIEAKANLGLDDKATKIPYAIKTTTSGVDIYMFAPAEKNKDWLQ